MKKILLLIVIVVIAQACSNTPADSIGIEPTAGQWKPWVLPVANQITIPPPPDAGGEQAEIKEIISVQKSTDSTALQNMYYWNAGPPSYRWQAAADDLLDSTQYFLRVYALLNVAIYDATLAAWQAKYKYNRKRPSTTQDGVKHLVAPPQTPSYPCEHSVTAGAGATMLAYLFPAKADSILTAAKKIGEGRVLAGVQYPSDVSAGFELGVKVANYVIEHWAKNDGGTNRWGGKIPTEPGYWKGKPMRFDIPNMKTWVLTSANQFRSVPPPDVKKDMAELKAFKRTDESNYRAFKWNFEWAWGHVIDKKVMEHGLLNNAPRAARAYTLLAIADYESQVANIESKHVYFRIRPDQYDPTFKAVFETPPSPGYPAGHATAAACYGEMLSYLFPADAKEFHDLANEEALSRFEAGVHFRTDNEAGMKLGKEVAQEIIKRAKADGADKL